MPAYELLCLCAPALGKQQLGNIVQRVASVLYSKQAVITDVKSYGDTPLAYKIKGTRGKYEQVSYREESGVSLGACVIWTRCSPPPLLIPHTRRLASGSSTLLSHQKRSRP